MDILSKCYWKITTHSLKINYNYLLYRRKKKPLCMTIKYYILRTPTRQYLLPKTTLKVTPI